MDDYDYVNMSADGDFPIDEDLEEEDDDDNDNEGDNENDEGQLIRKPKKKTASRLTFLRLFRFIDNKFLFFLQFLVRPLQSLGPTIISMSQGEVTTALLTTDFDNGSQFLQEMNRVTWNMILFTILSCIIEFIDSAILGPYLLPRISKNLEVRLFERILEQDIEFFEEGSPCGGNAGAKYSHLTQQIETAFQGYTITCSLFSELISLVSSFIICYHKSKFVTIYAIVKTIVETLNLEDKFTENIVNWKEIMGKNQQLESRIHESLQSFRTVKSFDGELHEYDKYKESMREMSALELQYQETNCVLYEVMDTLDMASDCFILGYLGIQASRRKILPGDVLVVQELMSSFISSLSGFSMTKYEYDKSDSAAMEILDMLERKPKIDIHFGNTLESFSGKIEFRNVSFTYPSRNTPAVDQLSFTVEGNETIAICGESGCGKSTILSLLQRFYEVDEGSILLDGVNIKELKANFVRSQISMVPQGPSMFSMQVKDNIRFGKVNANHHEVIQASKIANSHQFIVQLKDGYRTQVNQNNLSGGQKQRICIARSVLMNSRVVLLDEATASLDSESERLVQESLSNFKEGRTVIIVAHRLSTIRNADKIYVMSEGQIVESGTHEELLENPNGIYSDLVRNQLQ